MAISSWPTTSFNRLTPAITNTVSVSSNSMPSVKGITCSLKILGQEQPAQECGATIEDSFASAYVVAEANQRFHVNVVATEFVHEALEIYVYIDGKYQNSSIWTELGPNENLDETYHGKRERDGDNKIAFERPWKFDDLVIGRFGGAVR